MAITVRLAAAEGYVAVADLTACVYVGEGFSPNTADGSLRAVDERARQTRLLCAVDERGVVLGAVSVVEEGSTFGQIGGVGELEIRLLAVAPEARGHGVGEHLIKTII